MGNFIPRQVDLTYIRKLAENESVSQRVSQGVAFPVVSTEVPPLTSLSETWPQNVSQIKPFLPMLLFVVFYHSNIHAH